jgi:hypothetical protein
MEGFTRAHTLIEATDNDVNAKRYAAARSSAYAL